MKDVSADDSADGFDNTSLKKTKQEQNSLTKSARQTKRSLMKLCWNNTRAQRKRLARAITPSTFSLVKQIF